MRYSGPVGIAAWHEPVRAATARSDPRAQTKDAGAAGLIGESVLTSAAAKGRRRRRVVIPVMREALRSCALFEALPPYATSGQTPDGDAPVVVSH